MKAENPMSQKLHSIGEAASMSGVSNKMIRHYETIGLLESVSRSAANYRLYTDSDVHQLRFIRRARNLGFSMKEIGMLVSLWQSETRSSAEVRALAVHHLREMDARISEMQEMRAALAGLVEQCRGNEKPACPILESLANPGGL
jgi:MerR family transcriptional regulator, copper efflux regulator